MTTLLASVFFLLASIAASSAPRQDEAAKPDPVAAREAAFAAKMSGCKMVGFFTLDGKAGDNANKREPKEESYTIAKVEKLRGDQWRFMAKIEYGERSATLPIVVKVLWAGDTPVIQVTKIPVPTMGTYTARVLVYDTHYAGFWAGSNYGGHMYGRIVRADDEESKVVEEEARKQTPAEPAPDKQSPDKQTPKDAERSDTGKDREQSAADWPQFRGRFGRGIADAATYPTTWNVETGDNILWKTAVPGLSHSSPVLVGNRIFLTTAVPKDGKDAQLTVGLYGSIVPVANEGAQEYRVLCYAKQSGELLWSKTCFEGVPDVKRHPKGSHAAPTATSDGKYVIAHFGSEGLYCFDVDGRPLWNKSLGHLDAGYFMLDKAQWGFASSPVLHDGKVIVQCDIQGQSFLTVLDAATGNEVWRTLRDEVPTWGCPTIDERDGRVQIIVNGFKHIGGYDFASGKEIWKLRGGGDIPVPTPIVHEDVIYITNAHGRLSPIFAIAVHAEGDLSMDASECDHMKWSWTKRGNYMQTPLAHDKELYCCNDMGVLSCIDNKTGELVYRERMGGGRMGFTSSPILADGKLYFGSEDGEVHVVRAGRSFERLALNELGETLMATPAASGGVLYYRGRRHLFAIGERG